MNLTLKPARQRPVKEPTAKWTDVDISFSLSSVDAGGGRRKTTVSLSMTPMRTLSDGTVELDPANTFYWATGDLETDALTNTELNTFVTSFRNSMKRIVDAIT